MRSLFKLNKIYKKLCQNLIDKLNLKIKEIDKSVKGKKYKK